MSTRASSVLVYITMSVVLTRVRTILQWRREYGKHSTTIYHSLFLLGSCIKFFYAMETAPINTLNLEGNYPHTEARKHQGPLEISNHSSWLLIFIDIIWTFAVSQWRNCSDNINTMKHESTRVLRIQIPILTIFYRISPPSYRTSMTTRRKNVLHPLQLSTL